MSHYIQSDRSLTNQTGYVGGHTVDVLLEQHPDYQIVALVRNDSQADIVKAVYPTIETVIGDLDSDEIIQEEAGKADVVISKSATGLEE